jgi:uncharacterized protein
MCACPGLIPRRTPDARPLQRRECCLPFTPRRWLLELVVSRGWLPRPTHSLSTLRHAGYPYATQDSLPVGGHPCRVGFGPTGLATKGFRFCLLHVPSSLPRLCLARGASLRTRRGDGRPAQPLCDDLAMSILWRRLDKPGHESARIYSQDSRWHLTGTAVFAHEQQPCRLDYRIACDAEWRTVAAKVEGWVGDEIIDAAISVDPDRQWLLNDTEFPVVAGCIDLDLNFSPSTNLLPIRRLKLEIGEEASVRAAWLRFPSFTLEPLEQIYRRLDETTYRYESAGGSFVRELTVNDAGLVTLYPGLWQTEPSS